MHWRRSCIFRSLVPDLGQPLVGCWVTSRHHWHVSSPARTPRSSSTRSIARCQSCPKTGLSRYLNFEGAWVFTTRRPAFIVRSPSLKFLPTQLYGNLPLPPLKVHGLAFGWLQGSQSWWLSSSV